MRNEILVPGVDLLESMRSVGYSFEAAVADIIDNSIAAEASKIEVFADAVHGSYVAFVDDGHGMDPATAFDALKLAGTARRERGPNDLGRFGLGMKTASLSQCRRLTVISVKDGETTALQWDLDHVLDSGTWSIRVLDAADLLSVPRVARPENLQHGTSVVWEGLDYLLAGADDVAQQMAERVAGLHLHLGLVFQRFLQGPGAVSIEVNGLSVSPIDPFLRSNTRTQEGPQEIVTIEGHQVKVQPFTLPHPSSLGVKELARGDLGSAMREFQGFYVYRNRRLISRGGWFGLAKLDELTKQARVLVDVPPELDQHWQLDIKKSRIEPPQAFRNRFRQIIEHVTGGSRRMHTFRGRKVARKDVTYLWNLVEEHGGYRYEINRDHPVIDALSESIDADSRALLDVALRDIAAHYPAPDLYLRMSDNKIVPPPAADPTAIEAKIRAMKRVLGADSNPNDIVRALRNAEEFGDVVDLESLVTRIWNEET